MKFKHPIGELILYYKPTGGWTVGCVKDYHGSFYIIEWYGWVPPQYKIFISENEIDRFRENLLFEARRKLY
jgi:hypothetical protein